MRLIFLLALCLTICTTAFGGYETVVISELQTVAFAIVTSEPLATLGLKFADDYRLVASECSCADLQAEGKAEKSDA